MATLKVYKTASGQRYGVLSGGSTTDYGTIDGRWFESIDPTNPNESGDTRDWLSAHGMPPHEYAWSFERVCIKDDVESIGDYTFTYFENADFTFENPENIKHLGKCAFESTGIRSVKLPGLQDTTIGEVFAGCSKLTEVDLTGSAVTAIGANAFRRCHNLKRVLGCGKVTSIGALAFSRCPSLMQIDVDPRTLKDVGHAAFHISGIGDRLNGFRNTTFASSARKSDKFDSQTLAKIRGVALPDVGGLPQTVCEQSYPDIRYGYNPTYDSAGNVVESKSYDDYMSNGCLMLSAYHAYQRVFPDSDLDTFPAWWDEVDRRCQEVYGDHIYEHYRYRVTVTNGVRVSDMLTIFREVVELMGLECKSFNSETLKYGVQDEGLLTWDESAKREIWLALASGCGVIASVGVGAPSSREFFSNNHAVAIVGCKNGKLLVVDSASIDGERGGVYEVAYEDLFFGEKHAENYIVVLMPKGVNA